MTQAVRDILTGFRNGLSELAAWREVVLLLCTVVALIVWAVNS